MRSLPLLPRFSSRISLIFLLVTLISVFFCTASAASVTVRTTWQTRRFRKFRQRCYSSPKLVCNYIPTVNGDSLLTGTVFFRPQIVRVSRRSFRCAVHVNASLSGLSPGLHGFHIHTYGDLRKSDGTSTGGHFSNPDGTATAHGFPESPVRHWGDFGNVNVMADGSASFEHMDMVIRMDGIIGRGMIIHALEDQGPAKQPTGAAGARQAMCVIGIANPELD